MRPFHLAFPVTDLSAARGFYGDLLGCPEGRSSEHWVDFDFWGHQVVAHLVPADVEATSTNRVDGDDVPTRHFGVVLAMEDWRALAKRLKESDVHFLVQPHVRFEGLPGEQATLFIADPCGNAVEFKAFADQERLFAR